MPALRACYSMTPLASCSVTTQPRLLPRILLAVLLLATDARANTRNMGNPLLRPPSYKALEPAPTPVLPCFQRAQQPVEPFAEIVTTSTAPPPPTPPQKPEAQALRILGGMQIQYIGMACIFMLVCVEALAGVIFLWFTVRPLLEQMLCIWLLPLTSYLQFAGNAKQLQFHYSVMACSITAFYIALSFATTLKLLPMAGITIAAAVFLAILAIGLVLPANLRSRTPRFASALTHVSQDGESNGKVMTNIFVTNIVLLTLLYNLTVAVLKIFLTNITYEQAAWSGSSAPREALSPGVQAIYIALICFGAGVATAIPLVLLERGQSKFRLSDNLLTSFFSAFVVTASVAYVAAVGGVTPPSPLEPVKFFSMSGTLFLTAASPEYAPHVELLLTKKAPFDFKHSSTYMFLALWALLTISGYAVQRARDKRKLHEDFEEETSRA